MAYNYLFGGFKKEHIKQFKLTPYEVAFLKFLDYKENSLNHDEDPLEFNNKTYYKYYHAQLERDNCFFKDKQWYIRLICGLIDKGFIERADRKIWRTQLYLRLTDKYQLIKPKREYINK